MMSVTVIIPTYNGGVLWEQAADILTKQVPSLNRVKVIDSSSSDNTAMVAKSHGFEVTVIQKAEFDHGGTRSLAIADVETEFVVFLTQDAILSDRFSVSSLIQGLASSPDIVCAYGRQLPHCNANPLAKFTRYNSYSEHDYVTSLDDSYPKGFRKAFLSNSFAAYRVDFLKKIGGFPQKLILGEDSFIAAKALVAGLRVAYLSNACVYHSHNYSVKQEFQRYFDIGVFHTTQFWMVDRLGTVEGEGVKFALGQLKFLFYSKKYRWIFPSIFCSLAKFIGYKIGKNYSLLGSSLCRRLSMYKSYWK